MQSNRKRLFTRVTNRVLNWMIHGLCYFSIRRGRRMLYVSSILALIKELRKPEDETIRLLNEAFHLAGHDDSVKMSMIVNSAVWVDLQETSVVVDDRTYALSDLDKVPVDERVAKAIGVFFYQHCPAWLRYGSMTLMVEDIAKLIQKMNQLRAV